MKRHLLLLLLLAGISAGCATNPVTGKKEFNLLSEQQELAIGAQQYAPSRQSQGGDLVADPGLEAYVSQVGQRLAAVSDRKLPYEFRVLNNSVPNAWALPGGKIAINRGLLTELKDESELAAVLGHEIVHAAAQHGAQSLSKGLLLQAAVMGTAVATQGKDYAHIAQLGANLGALLITQKYGRDAEREADHYGMAYMVRAGYDPQGAVELQRTFVKLSEGKRQDWLSGLFATHPPSEERVQNNTALLAALPQGGERGEQRYRARIARQVHDKPAYAAYDKGRAALGKGDSAAAMRLAREAIAIEPGEGHFYALLGDAELHNGQAATAVQQYGRALALNPGYFYYLLQRGRANEQLGLAERARADLERSVALLPTADAYLSLGMLARKAGQLDQAKAYYGKVAGVQGEVGRQAYGELVDLDLADNPGTYIQLRVGRDAQGRVIAQISNPTPRNAAGIVLAVQFRDAAGQMQQMQRSLQGVLAAGQQQQLDLGLGTALGDEQLGTLRLSVVRAQVAR